MLVYWKKGKVVITQIVYVLKPEETNRILLLLYKGNYRVSLQYFLSESVSLREARHMVLET